MTKKESVIEQCVKGHWVPELKDDGDSLLRCSICNYPVSYFWGRTNFCPECGADMRGNKKLKQVLAKELGCDPDEIARIIT